MPPGSYRGLSQWRDELMLDINEPLFPKDRVSALQGDLDFIFSSYEVKRS